MPCGVHTILPAPQVFTLFYAPLAVVFTAGAINHVAGIPLEKRKSKLEDYVLDQFGDKISANDFHDVRRSAGLKEGEDIRSNDFLLVRLTCFPLGHEVRAWNSDCGA